MTVIAFPDPFWHHVQRRCGGCGVLVRIDLGNGAEAPREPHYRCSDCHESPAGVGRVLELVQAEGQQRLDGAA